MRSVIVRPAVAFFATKKSTGLDAKEKGDERVFFDKED